MFFIIEKLTRTQSKHVSALTAQIRGLIPILALFEPVLQPKQQSETISDVNIRHQKQRYLNKPASAWLCASYPCTNNEINKVFLSKKGKPQAQFDGFEYAKLNHVF